MSTPFRFKNADNTTVDFEDYYVRADYFRSGNLWVWGINTFGGLGDNTITNKSSPVQTVAGGSNWKQVETGYRSTFAIKTDGTLWDWGYNIARNLGDNTTTHRSSPIQTTAYGTNWKQVSSDARGISAGIKTDGTLWTWGISIYGAFFSNNTNLARFVPSSTNGTNWKQVSCGGATATQISAAINTDGILWTCGYNVNGELGDNTATTKSSPVQTIAGGTNWKQVSCGANHMAAIKTDGTLWNWGGGTSGQLGDNTATTKSSPVQTIAGGTNWKQVSCGNAHAAAIKTDGTLWCWGGGTSGQLGDSTATSKSSPVQTIAGGTNWKQVSCGNSFVAAVKTDGTLWTWGLGTSGQLGDNTITSKSSPVQTIMYGNNWKQVDCGNNQTAAIQYQDDYQ